MAEYKRIAGICSNAAMATLVRIHPELASREHTYLENMDLNGNETYRRVLAETRKQYFDMLKEKSESRTEQLVMDI